MYYNKADHEKSISIDGRQQQAPLPDQLVSQYISFIKERFGIIVSRDHRDLIRYIHAVCGENKLTPERLLEEIRRAEDSSELITHLVSSITIGETYFFRDKNQIRILSEKVLPDILKRKSIQKEKSIRIWSAGCSSGEEIYTIAMLLNDLLGDLSDWEYCFLATDINVDVLKKGISGVYGEWSMRSIPEKYLKKYFKMEKNSYVLNENIRKMVTFDYLNLNSEAYPSIMNSTTMHDLVLCRNVLIYFDHEHTVKIIDRLRRCLAESGYLMLGASDPVAMLKTNLVVSPDCPSLFTTQAMAAPVELPVSDKLIVKQSIATPIKRHAEPVVATGTDKSNDLATRIKKEINIMAAEARWVDVIKEISKLELLGKFDDKLLTTKAMALANTGRTDEALKVCEQCIAIDKLNKQAYFIRAILLSDLRKAQAAEDSFKKALYIDPDFLLCRYQFGLFLIRMNKISDGIKALKNVVSSAKKFPDDDVVPSFGSMKYKDLIASLNNEIELHQ